MKYYIIIYDIDRCLKISAETEKDALCAYLKYNGDLTPLSEKCLKAMDTLQSAIECANHFSSYNAVEALIEVKSVLYAKNKEE